MSKALSRGAKFYIDIPAEPETDASALHRRMQEGTAVLYERDMIRVRIFDKDVIIHDIYMPPASSLEFHVGGDVWAGIEFRPQEGRDDYPIRITSAWDNKENNPIEIQSNGKHLRTVAKDNAMSRGNYTSLDYKKYQRWEIIAKRW